ncbi:ATP-binding cassette domain-containing protein [Thermosyntropha sp.]|uniref:ABC transporter ATP-binding protein n=1 Tax=Thermosyntropha sp. TaxID=2740820 RepID=UPI0025D6B2A9|nr:ATP-binding cassette domain-containing protein [Thermosyntropha sp.]MBO8158441.1 ATP-binding cassette domain-containing protein [Thermosyntropha sp.]
MFEFVNVKYKEIVDLPSFCIEEGKVTTLVGQSGSGKTTILKLLNKMISPTQGKVLFKGKDLKEINSVLHRRNVVMLTQNSAIFPGTIRDNLNIGLMFQEKKEADDEVLKQILKKIMLSKDLDAPVATLSGGEKQRLALGRLLLLNPEVYLLDEPSSALDDETEEIIIKMLIEHVHIYNKTIIMVTHSKNIAEKYSDTIIEVERGRIAGRREVNARHH